MNTEKLLQMCLKAIEYLDDKDDTYGKTPIDMMRRSGCKSVENLTILSNTTGAWLETMRCYLLDKIEAEAAKKVGKSSIRNAVKAFNKDCYKRMIQPKPAFAYAHYDEVSGKYWLCNGFALLVADNSDGMTLCPEIITESKPFRWQDSVNQERKDVIKLPDLGKLSAWLKQRKAQKLKNDKLWAKVVLGGNVAVNGEFLETFMRITGATEIRYGRKIVRGRNASSFYIEGNGYQGVLMAIETEEGDQPTNFEEV